MGQEINTETFTAADREEYAQRLAAETELLLRQIATGQFANQPPVGGFEVEGWLVDDHYLPCANCDELLALLEEPLLTTELAQFNIELNAPPKKLENDALRLFEQDLHHLLNNTDASARSLGCHLFLIGILPDATGDDFSPENMTDAYRYRALNDQVLQARGEEPLALNISGREHLQLNHHSVMMEAQPLRFRSIFKCRLILHITTIMPRWCCPARYWQ